jgi:hypothetical protein
MNRKLMLLALASVSATLFAFPPVAAAESSHISSVGKFTIASEAGTAAAITEHNSSSKWICTSVTGSGEFTTTTTGKLTLSFHGCGENVFGTACTGEVPVHEPAGTITTTVLEFHLIEVENNTPGILITPNNGHFATYTCANGLITKKLGGNGLIGHLASICGGAPSTTHTAKFETTNESTPGHTQKWTQITTAGTKYDLTANGTTSALDAAIFMHFSDAVARSLICT